jgi:hypothetical protein
MPASANAMSTRHVPGGRTKPSVSSDDPLVTNASVSGPDAGPPVDRAEADDDERHPLRRQRHEAHGRVQGEHRVSLGERPARPGHQVEDPPPDHEVEPGETALVRPGDDHRLDGRTEGDEHQRHTRHHCCHLDHDHGRSLAQPTVNV